MKKNSICKIIVSGLLAAVPFDGHGSAGLW